MSSTVLLKFWFYQLFKSSIYDLQTRQETQVQLSAWRVWRLDLGCTEELKVQGVLRCSACSNTAMTRIAAVLSKDHEET